MQSRSNVQVDAEALIYSADGAAHPFVIADNVALPAIVQNNVQHTLGPITLGVTGTVINPTCIQNLLVDFGSGAETIGCGSDLYDTHLQLPASHRSSRSPVSMRPRLVPVVCRQSACRSPTRRRRSSCVSGATNGIGFVANGTAEHIKMTANGVAVVTQHTGQGTARAEVSIQITTSWDGTNAPVTIDTASAIS